MMSPEKMNELVVEAMGPIASRIAVHMLKIDRTRRHEQVTINGEEVARWIWSEERGEHVCAGIFDSLAHMRAHDDIMKGTLMNDGTRRPHG